MNRLQRFAFRMASKIAGQHPQDPTIAKWWSSLGLGTRTVTPETAMTYSGVYGAVTLISQVLSMLPFPVYKRVKGGKERDINHPLWTILMEMPNARQTPKEFKEMAMNSILLRGNAYGEIISTGGRAVSEVWLLHPDSVRVFEAPDKRRAYEHSDSTGQTRILLQDEMWHIMGPSMDGLSGLSPIEFHSRTIGKSILAEIHEERFFENDATPGVVLTHPGKLGTTGQQNLREAWEERHKGAGKSHRVGVLQEGITIHELGLTHKDSQYIELLKNGLADIARIFHVPLHMLAEMENSTFSNIEHQGIEFVTYTLMYWLQTWKESASRDLFTPSSRRTHFAEFNVEALLRGDVAARNESYTAGRTGGWLSVNEIRAKENMNAVKGGNVFLEPLNMQEVGADSAGIAET